MGMYTELVLKAHVKPNLPVEVESVLQALFNNVTMTTPTPDHPFFRCDRWSVIGQCCSYYHVPWVSSRYSDGRIFSRSDLKNYDGEITKFIEWVSSYLDEPAGNCIGWSWYEEDPVPTLILKGKTP